MDAGDQRQIWRRKPKKIDVDSLGNGPREMGMVRKTWDVGGIALVKGRRIGLPGEGTDERAMPHDPPGPIMCRDVAQGTWLSSSSPTFSRPDATEYANMRPHVEEKPWT